MGKKRAQRKTSWDHVLEPVWTPRASGLHKKEEPSPDGAGPPEEHKVWAQRSEVRWKDGSQPGAAGVQGGCALTWHLGPQSQQRRSQSSCAPPGGGPHASGHCRGRALGRGRIVHLSASFLSVHGFSDEETSDT